MERSLHQFLAVAETGSISAAAGRLNVTQPTITVNIKNLEERYRVPLFERTPRGMMLTEFGSILYENARVMARLENHAVEQIQQRRNQITPAIAVGCGHAWWRLFVRQALENMARTDGLVPIHVETGSNLQCMWKLLAGDITVSIGHRISHADPTLGTQFVPLFHVADAYFVAKDHPLRQHHCTPFDLATLRAVNSVPVDQNYRNLIAGADAALTRPLPYSTNSLLTCIDMVLSSGGYTTFPLDMDEMLDKFGLAPLTMVEPTPSKEVGIYFLTEKAGATELNSLIQEISRSASEYRSRRAARHVVA